jgi:hypothetical protein
MWRVGSGSINRSTLAPSDLQNGTTNTPRR